MLYGNESHRPGLVTAIYNLREFDQTRPILVLTPNASERMLRDLRKLKATVLTRPLVQGPNCKNSVGEGKDRLTNSFFKMHIWNLTEYRTVLYLESDMLFREPLDELFRRARRMQGQDALMIAPRGHYNCTADFAASFEPRRWNTGVMAIRPTRHFTDAYSKMLRNGKEYPCYGGSQEFENILFLYNLQMGVDKSHLYCMPLKYNCKDTTCVDSAAVVHWTGEHKPWDGGVGFVEALPEWETKRKKATASPEQGERQRLARAAAGSMARWVDEPVFQDVAAEWRQRSEKVEAMLGSL